MERYKELIIDAFAGGGGASVGIEMALGRSVSIAINHDPDAILMHKTNHPDTIHLTEDIFTVDLKKHVKNQRVALLWASPDCTSHSRAKGGKPREKGLRILPWAVYKHCKILIENGNGPEVVIMENVEEIRDWGPLDGNSKPIPERKGEDFNRFIHMMRNLGYDYDSRTLVAADYGAPTTRKRWYAVFRRDGKPIVWPEPTHSKDGSNGLKKWVPIHTVLDFTDLGKSIFGRKKPLAKNTMNRIARGLKKFVFENPDPFVFKVEDPSDAADSAGLKGAPFVDKAFGGNYSGSGSCVSEPVHTITTVDHNRLVTPVVAPFMMRNNTGSHRSDVKVPMLTITTGGHHGAISPFMDQVNHSGENFRGQSMEEPLPTITQKHGFGKATPYIMQLGHTGFTKDGSRSIEDPMSTVVTKQEHCLMAPFLVQYHSETRKDEVRGQLVENPVQTIDTSNRYGLVAAFLTKFYKSGTGQEMFEPIHTITTSPGHFGQVSVLTVKYDDLMKAGISVEIAQKCTWVSEFIMEYYGCGIDQSVKEPLHTIVTKGCFALITVLGNSAGDEHVILDIYLRMLTPEELKLGQGFPKDYIIDHTWDFGQKYPVAKQVARIGNSVVPIMAQKLVEANCGYLKVGEREEKAVRTNVYDQGEQMRFA